MSDATGLAEALLGHDGFRVLEVIEEPGEVARKEIVVRQMPKFDERVAADDEVPVGQVVRVAEAVVVVGDGGFGFVGVGLVKAAVEEDAQAVAIP